MALTLKDQPRFRPVFSLIMTWWLLENSEFRIHQDDLLENLLGSHGVT